MALLALKGYRIRERRLRTPAGEIDLIATRSRLLVFAEVKARGTAAEALEAVTARQRNRISRAAAWYLQQRRQYADYAIRFDAIVVAPGALPRHVKEAWRPDA
jgi:putative endonuclease